tara:strand:- start:341 stop:949 length:609 start_codon:yes stop_codon:yes gene_type:complete
MNANHCIEIFNRSIHDYHINDNVDQPCNNPFSENSIENLMYLKNWIDTVQWHYEDIIRDPNIAAENGILLKRKIDRSNQDRTDLVEKIDDYYIELFKNVNSSNESKLNTESPGWVVDRISILCLKIYHMQEQTERKDVSEEHVNNCMKKLSVLKEQQEDLSQSFNELLDDLENGVKKIKVYRQMKMYNDSSLNPVLYKKKSH